LIDLTVGQSTPAGTPPGSTTKTIHVNTLPVASISGPSSSDNLATVSFQGGVFDPDPGQQKYFRWVLVSRPSGSSATGLTPPVPGADNATLSPDAAGTYEVGLRVDDGMDNSALVSKTFTAGGSPIMGGGGGGGCSVTRRGDAEDPPSTVAALSLYLFPLWILALRKRYFFVVISSLFLK